MADSRETNAEFELRGQLEAATELLQEIANGGYEASDEVSDHCFYCSAEGQDSDEYIAWRNASHEFWEAAGFYELLQKDREAANKLMRSLAVDFQQAVKQPTVWTTINHKEDCLFIRVQNFLKT